jgi:hypothetical protein
VVFGFGFHRGMLNIQVLPGVFQLFFYVVHIVVG